MATAPVSRRLNLTRDQLAAFLTDQQQIRQFELLFAVVDELQAITGTDFEYQADTAAATANEALAQLSALAQSTAVEDAVLNAKVQQALDAVAQFARTLELIATAPAIENNNSVVTDYIDFNTTTPSPAVKVGRMHWNGGYTLNLEMTPNVNQAIGESQYYYIKASAAIAKGQLVMFDGSVGASGVLKGKPSTGVTNGQLIMGVAAEAIANNGFGLVSSFGLVRGFNTTGTPYGEVWADGDILYYNPSFAGGLTKNIPAAPLPHIVVAAVVNAATAGSGSVFVRVQAEPLVSQLSDVYISGIANGDLLQYDLAQQRWENVPSSTLPVGTATNLAGGAAGSVPYQSAPSTTTFRAIGTAGQVFRVNSVSTAPEWVSAAALTKVDDTNVTLTLGGSPTTALLAAASLTLGWSGQLSVARGGSGASTAAGARTNFGATTVGSNFFTLANPSAITFVRINADNSVSTLDAATFRTAIGAGTGSGTVTSVTASSPLASSGGTTPNITITGSALTKADDTNVTLTLGGSPSTALLSAVSISVGWSGNLAATRGGTGIGTYVVGDILYSNTTTTLARLGIGAANRVLTSSGSAPQWSTSLALAGSLSVASNTLIGTTSSAGITGNGLSVNSGSVGSSGFTAALSLTGSGGDFYAQNFRDSAGNCFYDLAVFSAATDLMVRAYRTSGGTVQEIYYAFANGNFQVVGALSKGSGSFRIEHPHPDLSPTHELVHSFIEGPQADLIYRGQVTLANGAAQVNIDQASSMTEGTFVLLCRDVQCFTSNETDWDNVRGKVTGNILTIESQNPTSSATISWMVVGERQDKHMMDTDWTDENGKVIVEPLKRNLNSEPIYPQGAEQ